VVADPVFFRDLAYVFAAAVVGGALAWMARQPLVLGYVLGGMLISPLTPGPAVSDIRTFEVFAEIGVVLLMFSLGIEFSLKDLLRVRWVALLGAPLGMGAIIALATGLGTALGWPPLQAVAVGAVLSICSSMVLARLLLDRGELHSAHGRVLIGIALVQDLAAVVLMVLLPALGEIEPGRLLAIGLALARAAAVLAPFGYLAAKVAPPIMSRAARTQSQELFLLVALALGLGFAALTQAVGLSLALGAFLAGLILSESDYAHETLARVLSLRDAFGALFFVTVGGLIDPRVVLRHLDLLGLTVGLVLAGNFAIWAGVARVFGYPAGTALLVGAGLTQIGEFSFVLIQVARTAGLVSPEVYNATLATSLITILVNAALVKLVGARVGRRRAGSPVPRPEPAGRRGHIVVCGFGRVGSAVGEALDTFGVPYVVIETDLDVVRALRQRGIPALFGDASHRRLLEAAGLGEAAMVIVALPEMRWARLAVRAARALNPVVPILARAASQQARAQLARAGATELVLPEFEAALTLIRHSLERLGSDRTQILAYLDRFRVATETGREAGAAALDALPHVREVRLGPGALADQSLREARIRERFGVTVVEIARQGGDSLLNPSPDTILRPGDRLRVFGLPAQLEAFAGAAEGGAA
jgi:CPA2 family monovalent cation:H+ antiporter-2